jgi:hypothetical protein
VSKGVKTNAAQGIIVRQGKAKHQQKKRRNHSKCGLVVHEDGRRKVVCTPQSFSQRREGCQTSACSAKKKRPSTGRVGDPVEGRHSITTGSSHDRCHTTHLHQLPDLLLHQLHNQSA